MSTWSRRLICTGSSPEGLGAGEGARTLVAGKNWHRSACQGRLNLKTSLNLPLHAPRAFLPKQIRLSLPYFSRKLLWYATEIIEIRRSRLSEKYSKRRGPEPLAGLQNRAQAALPQRRPWFEGGPPQRRWAPRAQAKPPGPILDRS